MPFETLRLVVTASHFQVPPSRYQNSESLMYLPRNGKTGAPELVLACVIAPVATEQFAAPPFGEAYTLMFGFTHPQSRGTIRLERRAFGLRSDVSYRSFASAASFGRRRSRILRRSVRSI